MPQAERRQFVYIPEVAPDSFLLFFEKRLNSTLWSVRDYSIRGEVKTRYGDEFGWLSSEALARAEYAFPAPVVASTELEFWHRETLSKNRQYLHFLSPERAASNPNFFPTLRLESLLSLPKARRAKELQQMLESSKGEDWIIWNFFQLLQECHADDWLETLARQAPAGESIETAEAQMSFWPQSLPEVDLLIESPHVLIHGLNQKRTPTVDTLAALLRNADGRDARLWCLVHHAQHRRALTTVIQELRKDPNLLQEKLSEFAPEQIGLALERMGILLLPDLARPWIFQGREDLRVEKVRQELVLRIDPRFHAAAEVKP